MTEYTSKIMQIESDYNQAEKLKQKIDSLCEQLASMNKQYEVMLEAQKLLATVSDENTRAVLDYIMGIINKALSELFPHDSRRIYLEKTLYRGQHAHINIKLTGSNGNTRDIELQAGTGLRQVISFLFVLSLVEIRKGRRIILADELLSGVHPVAKRLLKDIIQIFAEEGFEFAFVEYGMNDLGKMYIVEKPNDVATVTPIDGNYHDEVFMFNRPPESVDLSLMVDEGEKEEELVEDEVVTPKNLAAAIA